MAKQTRGKDTREKIRAAANDLFLKQGYGTTTVDSIVELAGVSKGTFYVHFKRKEDLLLEYGWRRMEHLGSMVPTLLTGSHFNTTLKLVVDNVLRNKTWSREVTRLTIKEVMQNGDLLDAAPHKLLQPLLEVAQARNEVRKDMPAEVLSRFVLVNLLGALQDWGQSGTDEDVDDYLDRTLRLIFAAIAPQA